MQDAMTVEAGLRWGIDAAGPESGEPVLLLHGFPEDRRSWTLQFGPLVRAGFRVYAADLPGYGDTQPPPAYDLGSLAGAVGRLVRRLAPDGVHLVGHDWGGIVGHALAAGDPNAIRSFVAVCAPHPDAVSAAIRHPTQLLRSWYVGAFQVPMIEKVLAVGDATPARLLFRGAELGLGDERQIGRALAYYRANLGPRSAFASRVGRIPVPGLVVRATRDAALGRPLMQTTADRFDDLRGFAEVPCGHFVHRERAATFNRMLVAFLASVQTR